MASRPAANRRDANGSHDESRQLVQALHSPQAYSEPTGSIDVIETHISWIFLADQFAYKLKKPVRFEFLDFSTAELRRAACESEVTLNGRLAAGIYLGVVPIVKTANGGFAVGRAGTPVEWVVKMKRLRADAALDVLIREGKTADAALEQLAKTLAAFYQNLPPVTVTVDDYRGRIEQHVRANQAELTAGLHHLDQSIIQRVHAAQLRVLKLAPDLLDERVRNARIVEGHGDLRPDHIYFNPAPVVIDCLEFNRELRTLDVADELAFLAMECDFLGARGIVEPIFERYAQLSGDSPPRVLIDFYQLYRACVRARYAPAAEQLSAQARSQWLAAAGAYLDLAARYAPRLGPPMLIVVSGLPGAGKSTIAERICQELGLDLLQTDALRRRLGGPPSQHVGFNQGRYRPEKRGQVYQEMHRQAELRLQSGLSVVLDGTYLEAAMRDDAADVAARHQAAFLSVRCECPPDVAVQRITTRAQDGASLSEVRPEFFDRMRQLDEPDPPSLSTLAVDTSSSIVEPIRGIFQALRSGCFGDARQALNSDEARGT